jgi:four helix bundle protein
MESVRMFNYEKLETWQEAIAFANLVHSVTKNFPIEERFGLTNQMRRAAVSTSSNLAESSSRNSRTDFARFVEIATGSAFEVVSQALVAREQGFLSESDFKHIYQASEKLGRMLSGLRKSLLRATSPSTINHQPSAK